jgi:hypothetical protein
MGPTVSEQESPSGRQIIELLASRLPESGDRLSPNVIESSIPMLVDRFRPKVRQQLFEFVRDRPSHDMALAKSLLLRSSENENITAAVLGTLDTARIINSGRKTQSAYSAFEEIQEACRSYKIIYKTSALSKRDIDIIKAGHLVTAIGGKADWRLVKDLVSYVESNPDFLATSAPVVIPLAAAVASLPPGAELPLTTVIYLADCMRQHPSENLRIAEAIRVHKGFDKGLVEQLLASDRTPLESGVL